MEIIKIRVEINEIELKKNNRALAGVAQQIEHQPENRKLAGLIPCQGTSLGSRPGPQLGVCKR